MSGARRAPAMPAAEVGRDEALETEVSSVLAAYAGDVRGAVRDLLVAVSCLENQVEHMAGGISVGYFRARFRRPPD